MQIHTCCVPGGKSSVAVASAWPANTAEQRRRSSQHNLESFHTSVLLPVDTFLTDKVLWLLLLLFSVSLPCLCLLLSLPVRWGYSIWLDISSPALTELWTDRCHRTPTESLTESLRDTKCWGETIQSSVEFVKTSPSDKYRPYSSMEGLLSLLI